MRAKVSSTWRLAVALALALSFSLMMALPAMADTAPVNLASAASFAVLAGSGITNTGTTTITGDVGSYETATITGFESVTLIGTNHGGDSTTQTAKTDLTAAYNDAAGRIPVTTVATELGGTSPVPGFYNSAAGTFGITGDLTLAGDESAVWIFQAETTLITAAGSQVILTGGARASNVYWQVGSSATLGASSTFRGNILARTSITISPGATVYGRALAQYGAVTLDTSTVTIPPEMQSYSDPEHATVSNSFTVLDATIYMLAYGLAANSSNYRVSYYDGDGNVVFTDPAGTDSTATGQYPSSYMVSADPVAAAGTWHAALFDISDPSYTAPPPATWDAVSAAAGFVCSDSFEVDASAIPEFPEVATALGVAALAAAAYLYLRNRRQPGLRAPQS